MIALLITLSIVLFVATLMLSLIVYITIQRARTLMIDFETLQGNYDAFQEYHNQFMGAYKDAVGVVGGNLFQNLDRLRAADISIIYNNEVSELYKNMLEAHEDIYNIMSHYNVLNGAEPLPKYMEDAKIRMEKKYLNVKTNPTQAQFRHVLQNPQSIGVQSIPGS